MIKKINFSNIQKVLKGIKKDKYVLNPFYLTFNGYYEEKNEEILIYERDELYQNDFPFIVFPKKINNLRRGIFTHASKKDLNFLKGKKIQLKNSFQHGSEFYYKTKDIIEMKGSNFSNFRKKVKKFEKENDYKILKKYPKAKVLNFIKEWARKQKNKNELFDISLKNALFCVNNMEKIKGSWIFIEIKGKLVGYSLSCKLEDDLWVGIHQKIDYKYKGLGRFLMYNRALEFENISYFTLGTEAKDEGIGAFKESLNPIRKEERHFIVTD